MFGIESGFNPREKIPLFEPHVGGERFPEFTQVFERSITGENTTDLAPDLKMFVVQPGDLLVAGWTVKPGPGQQDLFFDPEVKGTLLLPELPEHSGGRNDIIGVTKQFRLKESVVMLVRKRDQGFGTLHGTTGFPGNTSLMIISLSNPTVIST